VRVEIRERIQAYELEKLPGNFLALGRGYFPDFEAVLDILQRGVPGKEGVFLEDDAAVVVVRQGCAVHPHGAGSDFDEAGENVEQGGFPASREADQADKLTICNVEVDRLKRAYLPFGCVVNFSKILDLNFRYHRRPE